MANEKIDYKSSTELALRLYPLLKEMIDSDPKVASWIMAEALYLLMQMVDGPSTAGQIITRAQVRQ
ncbi:hypothetical protein [Mixta intestinalis]|jgi:hypothetical protein|uniref:Uncharacterized protein n=1 Tax=Mixta intestinalis TaxID=1615494 RepID=A0A6P1PYH2_9GAMM|nr:hypothetical protein [Mixta intestinalis]QHM71660.1 hypothetical protein C7M51_01951 [Mixta intestinalis]